MSFTQSQEQLLGRLFVDRLGRSHSIELGDQLHELTIVSLTFLDQVSAHPPVALAVKVFGGQFGQEAHKVRMGDAARQNSALEAFVGVDHFRRHGCTHAGRAAGRTQLHGQPEAVVCEPPGVVALGRLGDAIQELLNRQIGELPIRCSVKDQPHTMDGIRLCSAEVLLKAGRIVRRVFAGRESHDANIEALLRS